MSNVRRPTELFNLDMLARQLSDFKPPQGPHDPAGAWTLDYQLVSLASEGNVKAGTMGSLRLVRRPLPGNRFTLDIDSRKHASGGYCARLAGKIEARVAPLPIPETWSWTGEILPPPPATAPVNQLSHTAKLADGQLKLSGRQRAIPLAGPATINWLLFEAVGRLPREPFAPLEFTLIDDFDLPKPHHRLHFAETIELMLGGQPTRQTTVQNLEKGRVHTTTWEISGGQIIPLRVYPHLGDANMPWIYWVDAQGRLLFAVSGLEAYVLNAK